MGRRNIGVAIGLPGLYAHELQGWRESLGDPNARAIPPHITLLPPTALGEHRLREVEEHLSAVAGREAPFPIHLRGSGTFRPTSPVVFVALAAGVSDCERLEAAVRSGPLGRTVRFPYHPHVTVAHDLPNELLDRAYGALAGYEARFQARGFTLFEQGGDGVWRPHRDFPFGQPVVARQPAPATRRPVTG